MQKYRNQDCLALYHSLIIAQCLIKMYAFTKIKSKFGMKIIQKYSK